MSEPATAWAPYRYYSAEDLADAWGLKRATVYQIPEQLLPKRRVGPKGGRVVYLGRDVSEYESRDKRHLRRAS